MKLTFECDGCHSETQFSYGYCDDEEPWSEDAKWYCGKCYREKTVRPKQINRRGVLVDERST